MSYKNFDDFVAHLEQEILEEELKTYNEYVVKLFHNPQNWGEILEEERSVWHAYEGPCGDTMQFYLKIKDEIIEDAKYITDGCGATVAAGSQTTMMIKGKSIDYAENLTEKMIDEALHGLPPDHKHCAELAATTLLRAIQKYKYSPK